MKRSRMLTIIHQKLSQTSIRLFISYLAVAAIPFLLVSITMSTVYYDKLSAQYERDYIDKIQISSNVLAGRFSDMESLSQVFVRSNWLRQMAQSGTNSMPTGSLELKEYNLVSEQLKNYRALNDGFVTDFAICFPARGIVLSPDGLDTIEWFFGKNYKYENIAFDEWMQMLEISQPMPVLLGCEDVMKYNTVRSQYTYITRTYTAVGDPPIYMLFFIEKDVMDGYFKNIASDEYSSAYLFGPGESLVASCNNVDDRARLAREFIGGSGQGQAAYQSIGKGLMAAQYQWSSSTSGAFHIVSVYSKDVITSQLSFLKVTVLAIGGAILVVSVVMAYIVSRKSYKPIKNLVNLVEADHPGEAEKTSLNDYRFLEAGIQKMIHLKQSHLQTMEEYQNLYLKECIEQLLNGCEGKELAAIAPILRENGLDKPYFTAVVMDGNSYRDTAWGVVKSGSICCYAMLRKNLCILLLNSDERWMEDEPIGDVCRSFCEDEVTIGAGETYGMDKAYISYSEAQISYEYQLMEEKGKLRRYQTINLMDVKRFYYKLHDGQLRQDGGLTAEQLAHYVRFITNENIAHSSISLSMERLLFYKKVQHHLQRTPDERLIAMLFSQMDHFHKAENFDQIQKCLEDFYRELFVSELQQKQVYSNELTDNILAFANSHYTDPNLSLISLSDHFDMSQTKMSLTFKEKLGENFSVYITKKRIAHARQLLEGSQLAIGDVMEQCGFDNPHTFRRVFKKHLGLTPSEYRDQCRLTTEKLDSSTDGEDGKRK